MKNKKLVIITTVPETLATILNTQPKFLSQKYEVHLVSSSGVKEVAIKEGCNFSVVNMYRGISPVKDLCSIYQLSKVLLKIKPDLIHSYTPKAGLISALASFFVSIPVRIHTFTGLIFPTETGFKHHILKFMDKLVVTLNTHIVCEGKGVKHQLESAGFSERKLKIIGNGNIAGVDLDYFSPNAVCSEKIDNIRSRYKLKDPKLFIYIGRLNKDKGIKELVQSFVKLNGPSRLILIGVLDKTLPPDNETLRLIQEDNQISHLGFMHDIRPFLSLSDCLILPSYREGFPNVILQAGAMGIPCIVTDVPGSNEIITQNENGWIVRTKCSSSLINAMEHFLTLDETKLITVKESAIENIKNKYGREFYQKELVKYYEEVLRVR